MTHQPLVSVIVPNYNYARYLSERIDSILNQSFRDFEVILLDDASTDNSREVIETYSANQLVTCIDINEKNTGSPFVQWEKGIKMARGKYIWIAEADDVAEPDFLKFTVEALNDNPQAALAMTMSHLIDSDGNPSTHQRYETFDEDGLAVVYDGDSYLASRMMKTNSCYNASMVLFRKEAYEAMASRAYLDMRYCGDWYFWVELISGHRVVELHKRLNRFRLHSTSTTRRGAVTLVPGYESSVTILRILMLSKSVNFDYRKVYIYRVLRDIRRGRYTGKYADMLNQLVQPLVESRRSYVSYWIYKHFIHSVASMFCCDKHFKPLNTYRI